MDGTGTVASFKNTAAIARGDGVTMFTAEKNRDGSGGRIRRITFDTAPDPKTESLVFCPDSLPGCCVHKDGPFSSARFGNPTLMTYAKGTQGENIVFVVDKNLYIRAIDVDGGATHTLPFYPSSIIESNSDNAPFLNNYGTVQAFQRCEFLTPPTLKIKSIVAMSHKSGELSLYVALVRTVTGAPKFDLGSDTDNYVSALLALKWDNTTDILDYDECILTHNSFQNRSVAAIGRYNSTTLVLATKDNEVMYVEAYKESNASLATTSPTTSPTLLLPTSSPTFSPTASESPPKNSSFTLKIPEILVPARTIRVWAEYGYQTLVYPAYQTWNISYRDPSDGTAKQIESFGSAELILPPKTLIPELTYRLCFSALVTIGEANITVTECMNKTTASSALDADIRGGEFRQVATNSAFTVDGSMSSDPDTDEKGNFTWTCERKIGDFLMECDIVCTPDQGDQAKLQCNQALVTMTSLTIYFINMTYSVVLPHLTRSVTVQVQIEAREPGFPEIYLSGGGNVGLGSEAVVVSNAVPSATSTATYDDLTYEWRSLNLGDSNGTLGIIPGETGASLSQMVSMSGPLVPGNRYRFQVTVTDSTNLMKSVSNVVIAAKRPALVTSASVVPSTGIEYLTLFTLSVSTSGGTPPLTFQYVRVTLGERWDLTFPTDSTPVANGVQMKAGDHSIHCEIVDALGGTVDAYVGNASVRLKNPSVPVPEDRRDCYRVNSTLSNMRVLFSSVGISAQAQALGVCDTMNVALDELESLSRFDQAMRLCQDMGDIIKGVMGSAVQNTGERLSDCGELVSGMQSTSGAPSGCTDGVGAPVQTIGTFTNAFWRLLAARSASLAQTGSVLESNPEQGLRIMRVMSREAGGLEGDAPIDSLQNLTGTTQSLIEGTSAQSLRSTAGDDAASALADIISLLDYSATDAVSASACSTLSEAMRAVTSLASKRAQNLAPDSTPGSGEILRDSRKVESSSFSMSSFSIFQDESANVDAAGDGSGATVAMPRSGAVADGSRPSGQLSVIAFNHSTLCRNSKDILQGSFVSVSLESSAGGAVHTFAAGETMSLSVPLSSDESPAGLTCGFWQESGGHWNKSGCNLEYNATARVVSCVCSHLTEFAMFREQSEDKMDKTTGQALFTIFAAVFALLTAVSGVQLFRLLRAGRRGQVEFAHAMLLAQCLARSVSCAFFTGGIEAFSARSLDRAASLSVVALPYTFAFWTVTLVIFQYAVLLHQQELRKNTFRRHVAKYVATSAFVTVCAWAFFGATMTTSSAAVFLAATIAFACICSAFAVCFLVYGRCISRLLAHHKNDAAKIWKSSALSCVCFLGMGLSWLASLFLTGAGLYAATAVGLCANAALVCILLHLYSATVSSAGGATSKKSQRGSSGRARGGRGSTRKGTSGLRSSGRYRVHKEHPSEGSRAHSASSAARSINRPTAESKVISGGGEVQLTVLSRVKAGSQNSRRESELRQMKAAVVLPNQRQKSIPEAPGELVVPVDETTVGEKSQNASPHLSPKHSRESSRTERVAI